MIPYHLDAFITVSLTQLSSVLSGGVCLFVWGFNMWFILRHYYSNIVTNILDVFILCFIQLCIYYWHLCCILNCWVRAPDISNLVGFFFFLADPSLEDIPQSSSPWDVLQKLIWDQFPRFATFLWQSRRIGQPNKWKIMVNENSSSNHISSLLWFC